MRVMVTGHRGYIGSVLTPMLKARGHTVIGMDSDLYGRCTFGDDAGCDAHEWIRQDIREAEAKDFAGVDAVLHLAGLSNDPLGELDPQLTDEINHRATVHLAELAKRARVGRFVFSSSCSNYGASGEGLIDESAPFRPVTAYGRSKVDAERGLARLADGDFCVVCLRSATAYGYSPRIRFDLVLNNLVAWACTTGQIVMKSDGSPWRPIVHIEDISRAFVSVLEAPRAEVRGRAFNVGRTDQNFQVRAIAQTVGEVVGGCEVRFAADAGPDTRCYRVNCDLLGRTVPTFAAVWDVRTGAMELRDAYQRYGLTRDAFEGPRYQRVAHLRWLMDQGIVGADLRYQYKVYAT
jgi:nucleoside-diphosphate-sugar epimerase